MGKILNETIDAVHPLHGVTTLGRGEHNAVRIDSLQVSNSHAEIRWLSEGWHVRDLQSTNGTFVNGLRITNDHRLRVGDEVRFGPQDTWRLIDDRKPDAMATSTSGARRSGNPLALPDDTNPQFVVASDGVSPIWTLLHTASGEVGRVEDQHTLLIDGAPWVLNLPAPATTTLDVMSALLVGHMHLRFEMDGNEPRAMVVSRPDGKRIRLPSAAFQRQLYWLAKRRLDDEAELADEGGVSPDPEAGWTDAVTLRGLLGCDRQRVNVENFRARDAMSRNGIDAIDFQNIVETRRSGRQAEYRIGTANLEIVVLET